MFSIRGLWNHIVTAWQMVGMMVIILVVLDLIAAPFVYFHEKRQKERQQAVRAAQYDGAKWALGMFREQDALLKSGRLDVWHAYDYWTAVPYKGKYFNIDSDGLRRTFNQTARAAAPAERPFRIFVFGGSTLFGLGARDDYTIPSFLAKDLSKDGIHNVEVFNYGQPGYSSTQEVISLLLQLKRGNIPDLVIFCDGVNDTVAAYQDGAAGLTLQEYNRAREFNILNPQLPAKRVALYTAALLTFVNANALGKLMRAAMLDLARPLYERIHGWLPYNRSKSEGGMKPYWAIVASREIANGLPHQVVETYAKNMRLVEQAGKDAGFKSVFYWQPVIYSKSPLSDFEKETVLDSELTYAGLDRLMAATYADVRQAAMADGAGIDLHDISDVLNDEKSCFWDAWHITETCDAVVAARIEKNVLPIVAPEEKSGHIQRLR